MSDDPFGSGGSLDGCIRIGEKKKHDKSGKMFPTRLDYFIATHPYKKEADSAPKHTAMNEMLERLHGQRPQRITIILGGHRPEDVFRCGFAYWPGKVCACSTDSSSDFRVAKRVVEGAETQVECDRETCPKFGRDLKPPKCNPFGILKFRFEHAPKSGGYWRFTTHSWNSIRKIRSNLTAFYEYTNDLNGLEVDLLYEKETAVVKGQQTDIPTVRLVSHFSPAELTAGMGRKFTSPARVEILVPPIKTLGMKTEVEDCLQENKAALGLNEPPDELSDEDFL